MLHLHVVLRYTFLLFITDRVISSIPCQLRNYGYSYKVCVCNKVYCDTIDPIIKPETGEYHIFVSNRAGDRFKKSIHKFSPTVVNPILNLFNLNVKFHEQYQTILGFGGAFTDSTGINILKLNETGHSIIKSYFSKDGLEYNVCRVPMGGTDFSTFGYSYLDYPSSSYVNEKNYSLVTEDLNYKIPFIKFAKNLSADLLLYTSTWTAPKSWKTNRAYEGPGQLKYEYYRGWADYFLRFLDLYRNESINFWGITTGNEAFTGFVPTKIPTVAWYPWEMKKWLIENLGPTLRNSEWHKDINIITLDDQRFILPIVEKMIFDNVSSTFINGIGTHWYWDEISPSFLLDDFHYKYSDKFILATEACTGAAFYDHHGVVLGSWERGERYALSIIDNLQHWAVGWVDWNMALDENGGPTFIDNTVDSPIVVNASAQEFYKQPMFYAIGHFSKFLTRGSVRIGLEDTYRGLKMVAFKRPDSILILIIVNAQPYDIPIKIYVPKKGIIDIIVDHRSFTSLVV